jgi:ribosome-binding factor A
LTPEHQTRVRRVAEAVREELALLLTEEVKDPGAKSAVLTRVEMAKDLRSARVYVRLLEGGDDEGRRRILTEALERASGLLRRELTHRLGLRFAPTLRFHYDQGQDNTDRVEQLLAEIEVDRSKR